MTQKKSINIKNHQINEDIDNSVIEGDCLTTLNKSSIGKVHLTFFDPPYRQGKDYRFFDDNQSENKYWIWIKQVLENVHRITEDGGAFYFMHREKNSEQVFRVLRESNWTFQNLIIWKKKTSAVPNIYRFSKSHQIIVFSTKGKKPRVFNKLRIDPPLLKNEKYERDNGIYLSDVWSDIRELTSGYFAGDEPFRNENGERVHKQQTPIALLLRIIMTSTKKGDTVLDPNAGTGTTAVVSNQLNRNSKSIEIDPEYCKLIRKRLNSKILSDDILKYRESYRCTKDLEKIWPTTNNIKGEKLGIKSNNIFNNFGHSIKNKERLRETE